MWETIRDIEKTGTTILLTSHYEEAQILCDRVAIMDRGKVIALGTPDALIQQNFDETVIEFGMTGDQSPDGIFNRSSACTIPGRPSAPGCCSPRGNGKKLLVG